MNKKKFMSLILALVMMVGAFFPLTAMADNANEPGTAKIPTAGTILEDDIFKATTTEKYPSKTTLYVHKLQADTFDENKVPTNHNGGKLDGIKLGQLGKNVKGLNGVKFTYFKVTDEQLKTLQDDKSGKNSTVAGVKELLNNQSLTGTEYETKTVKGENGILSSDGTKALELENGNYWFVESGYTQQKEGEGAGPENITKSYAVPFGITLPLTNVTDITIGQKTYKAGSVYLKNVHVYPKNIGTNKVEIDKNFLKEKVGKVTDEELARFIAEAKAGGTSEDKINAWLADIKKYDTDKDKISLTVGTNVPYDVLTKIPQNNTYKSMSWSDIMTKGLTYNDDLVVTVKAGSETKTFKVGTKVPNSIEGETLSNAEYKHTDYGFSLYFKESTDAKNEIMDYIADKVKAGEVEVRLQYSATVNSKTVVDKPEDNKITYTPGEPDPGHNVTPSDGKITVTKTWDENPAPTGVEVTYYLIADGKVVDSVTKTGPDYSHTFTGLDDSKTYTVREVVRGYKPEYTQPSVAGSEQLQPGAVAIKNTKTPDVLVPKTPKVTTGGKKFVKTDSTGNERLVGAEFVIQNKNTVDTANNNKYLVLNDAETTAQANIDYMAAQKAYDDAIDAVNAALAKGEISTNNKAKIGSDEYDTKDAALSKIEELRKDRDEKFEKANYNYTWTEKAENATKFYTDKNGQFFVKGLAYGDYQAVETKAPVGYALPKDGGDFTFKIKEGSFAGEANELDYKKDDSTNDGKGMQIKNNKLTIPQTGGIGTVIFTVVGISLMAGAFIAMRKRTAEEN